MLYQKAAPTDITRGPWHLKHTPRIEPEIRNRWSEK